MRKEYFEITVKAERKKDGTVEGDILLNIECRESITVQLIAQLLMRLYNNDPAATMTGIDLFKGGLK